MFVEMSVLYLDSVPSMSDDAIYSQGNILLLYETFGQLLETAMSVLMQSGHHLCLQSMVVMSRIQPYRLEDRQ